MLQKLFRSEDKKLLINLGVWLLINFLMFLILEIMQRGLSDTFNFTIAHKQASLLNFVLLLIVTLPALLFKRTHFVTLLLDIPWILAGIINILLTQFRGSPFIWSDIYTFKEALALADQYISLNLLLIIVLALILVGTVLWFSFRIYFKSYKVLFLKRVLSTVLVTVLLLSSQNYLMAQIVIDPSLSNTTQLYQSTGFMASFVHSYLATFQPKMTDYSAAEISEVLAPVSKALETQPTTPLPPKDKPNIIMLQVEAFCDPRTIGGTQYPTDPIPNFRKYYTQNYSGLLQVPTIGGSTARTEFEVLTGLSMDFLPPGDVPYTSGVVARGPIETIAYVLKNQGYPTTAIHNFEGNFYDRNLLLPNLGMDTYIPMETMNNLVKYRAFPEDPVLLDYIKQTLESTPSTDFVFTITAGTHGPYINKANPKYSDYAKGSIDKNALYQLQNYISLLRRTDKFIGQLADYVLQLKEPTILVIYGDHYPALDALKNISPDIKFKTPYVVIDNKKQIPISHNNNIEAYQLSTELLKLCGLEGGVMNEFHTTYKDLPDYQNKFELIQYDALFGKGYAEGSGKSYAPTSMKIGLENLEITSASYKNGVLKVKGTGFTQSSKLFLNDTLLKTKFITDNELSAQCKITGKSTVQAKLLGRKDVPILDSNVFSITN